MRTYTQTVVLPIGAFASREILADKIYVLTEQGIDVFENKTYLTRLALPDDTYAITYCGGLVYGGYNKIYVGGTSYPVDGKVIDLATTYPVSNLVWGITDAGKVFRLDTATGVITYVLDLQDYFTWRIQILQGKIYISSLSGTLYIYDGTLRTLKVGNIDSVALYNDYYVIAGFDDGDVKIVDHDGNIIQSISFGTNTRIRSVKISGDYAYVVEDAINFRLYEVNLKTYSIGWSAGVQESPVDLLIDESKHRLISIGVSSYQGHLTEFTYADSIDVLTAVEIKLPSVDVSMEISVKQTGGGGDDPKITYDDGSDLVPLIITPIMVFQYKGTLTGAFKKLSAISGQYPLTDPFAKEIKLVANPYNPKNSRSVDQLYGYSKGQKAGDISRVKLNGHLNAKTSTSLSKTVLWSINIKKENVANYPHLTTNPPYVLYMTPLLVTGLDDIRKYSIGFQGHEITKISVDEWNARMDFESFQNTVPYDKIYAVYADGDSAFRLALFKTADYLNDLLVGTCEVYKYTVSTETPAYETSSYGIDPPYEMESDDPVNEDVANHLARLTFLTRAPKRTFKCEILDGWPKAGDGVELDGELYVITSVSYSRGVFTVSGEYVHGGASGSSNVRTLNSMILNKASKPKVGEVVGLKGDGFVEVQYEGHQFIKLRQQGADNESGWTGVDKPNPIFGNPYEE
ncbi:MAG: hypothetical protein M1542_07555 [Thermotogae bacterium]|jgi:hypothetical protein|nr:hypothetical protein [Thermotogota bacterium]MCL5033080.1 hypothetical protein [Thermotogota bacterium]